MFASHVPTGVPTLIVGQGLPSGVCLNEYQVPQQKLEEP